MNRNSVVAIVLATFAAASTQASEITAGEASVDSTPFVSTQTRAAVQAQLAQPGPDVWAMNYNPAAQFQSRRTRAEVTGEFLASRSQIEALSAEDSGSAYLVRARAARAAATRVAARAQ